MQQQQAQAQRHGINLVGMMNDAYEAQGKVTSTLSVLAQQLKQHAERIAELEVQLKEARSKDEAENA